MYPTEVVGDLPVVRILHYLLWIGLLLWCVSAPALDERTLIPPPSGPGPQRMEQPRLPESQPQPSILDLPPVAPPSHERLSTQIKVRVRRFELTGNTVFSTEELASVTAPYENRVITTEEMQEVRHRLTLYYVKRGYINSGAIIPDQQVADGVIRLHIVEGKLSEIGVTGQGRLRQRFITKRIAPNRDEVLNVQALQQRLQLLQQSDLIKRLNAELSPGVKPGEAGLNVKLIRENPWVLGVVAANNRSPSVGAERTEIFGALRNLSGWGDTIGLRFGLNSGGDDLGVFYSLPVTARDTTLRLSFDRSDASVVEEPFNALDIDSELQSYRIGVSHPLYRTPLEDFSLGLTLDRRQSKTSLLSRPFSFSAGVPVDGESDVSVLRFSQDWLKRSLTQVIAVRSTLSWGMDILGVTANPSGPDGQFLSWLGQFQWARRFGSRDYQVLFRSDLQLAKESLLPLEQCAAGGADTVRGYRVNQLVRDNCFVSSVELRIPVFRLPIPKLSRGPRDGFVQLAPFGDFGMVWNTDEPTPGTKSLPSLGLGVRWDVSEKIAAQLYWGHAFRDFEVAEHDLQDDGISFRVAVQLY